MGEHRIRYPRHLYIVDRIRQEAVTSAELDQAIQVIWGREDQVIPASQAEGLPPQVTLRLLEGVGHMPHMEQAGAVNQLIAAFTAA